MAVGKDNIMNNTRTVDAVLSTSPMYFYDKDQTKRKLGDVSIERFDQGSVATYVYTPDKDNGMTDYKRSRDRYALGVGTGRIDTVNPASVEEVLIDQGWQISDYKFARGGACLTTIFTHTDKKWEDSIAYDGHLWTGRENLGIFPAIMAEFNLQISHMAVRLSEGIFRTICINGMFVRVFRLGQMTVRHLRNDTLTNLPDRLNQMLVNPEELPGGQRQMSKTNLAQTIYYLTRSYERMLEDGGKYIKKDALDLNQLTPFRPHDMRKNEFYGLMDCLKTILDKPGDDVTSLDLTNAYTSMVNLSGVTGTRNWSMFHGTETVLDSLIQLGKFSDFFDGTFQMPVVKPDIPEPLLVPDGPENTLDDVDLDQDTWDLDSYLRTY